MKSAIALEPESTSRNTTRKVFQIVLGVAALFVIGVLVWQGITAGGNPNPTAADTNPMAAIFDIAVLVFREGLECVLVLAAITASMVGENEGYRKPVAVGVGIGAIATIITWFVAVGIISNLGESVSALNLQAATGLLAIIVLLIIMNWFFHKVYWGGWICMHNRKKKELLQNAENPDASQFRLLRGLALLGFASFYREGFEIVLFLQGYNLKLGTKTVMIGALIGLILTGIVAVMTFIAHRKLPYRKMLELTGVLLGAVLLVMVGEQMQEMQLAHWISTTPIPWLQPYMPDWMGMWFAIFPTVETLAGQAVAAIIVIGSFFVAKKQGGAKRSDVQVEGSLAKVAN
ncbi:MAG: FTR1 family protein [Chthoniobacterales bacterium]